jgi:hypothetical protein
MKNTTFLARRGRLLGGLVLAATLPACGGGGGTTQPPPVTAPPVPAVAITAKGEGALVVHPSADSRFAFALETPIRITETAGGTADWNFARITLLKKGKVNEVFELGSDVIERAGFKKVAARSDRVISMAFRFNDENFDDGLVTLGFADLKDGRQFTVADVTGWNDVQISLTPLSVPESGVVKLGR